MATEKKSALSISANDFAKRIKEKFPVYKDIPDDRLAILVAKKYPVYQPIVDKSFGTITQAPETPQRKAEKFVEKTGQQIRIDASNLQQTIVDKAASAGKGLVNLFEDPAFANIVTHAGKGSLGAETETVNADINNRITAPVRAGIAGLNPLDAIKDPYKVPSFTKIFEDDLNKVRPDNSISRKILVNTLGAMADLGTQYLLMKGAGKAASGAVQGYQGVQRVAFKGLHEQIMKEFKIAGLDDEIAAKAAEEVIVNQFLKANAGQKTPFAVKKTTDMLRENEGVLGARMKEVFAKAQTPQGAKLKNLGGPEFYYEFPDGSVGTIVNGRLEKISDTILQDNIRKAPVVFPKKGIATKATGPTPKWLREEYEKSNLRTKGTPFVEADLQNQSVRDAIASDPTLDKALRDKLLGPAPEQPSVRPALPSEPAPAPEQTSIKTANDRLGLIKQRADRLKAMKNEELVAAHDALLEKAEEDYLSALAEGKTQKIKVTEEALNDIQEEVSKRLHGFGEAGYIDATTFEDALTEVSGIGEKVSREGLKWTKRLGVPFYIAEKYPAFKPVHSAIRESVHISNELLYEAMAQLQPKDLLKLPVSKQKKVVDAIQVGNSPTVQKYFTPEELQTRFGLDAEQVDAYNRIKNLYQGMLKIKLDTKRHELGYDDMTPEQQASIMLKIANESKALGGYVTQQRLKGDWAVVKPGEGDDFSFNLYLTKSEAKKAAEKLGPTAKVYLRSETFDKFREKLSLSVLDQLIGAAEVDASAAEIQALRAEIRKRSFSSHWITRQNDPGYDWNWENIVRSAIEYSEGATYSYGKAVGRIKASKAFMENRNGMDPALRKYTEEYINQYFNTGIAGSKNLQRFMYAWRLGLKPRVLIQDLATPILTTWPEMSKYYKGVNTEKVWVKSYADATNYLMKKTSGLDKELVDTIDKLRRQGVLGTEVTKFMLGIKGSGEGYFERGLSVFMRAGETLKRVHSAVVGYDIAKNQLNLTGTARHDFISRFVEKTSIPYGRHEIPSLVGSSGVLRNGLRTMYTFRHFTNGYLHFLANQMRGNSGQRARAFGSILAMSGIKGLPFFAVLALGYAAVKGTRVESDARILMKDAGIPDEVINSILNGVVSQATGVETSNVIGAGDAISVYGDVTDFIVGAPAGFSDQFIRAAVFAHRGDLDKALENASPDVIRDLLKADRMYRKGLTNFSGEKLSDVNAQEAMITALGFQPASVARKYEERDAIRTVTERHVSNKSTYHHRIAVARATGHPEVAARLRKEARRNGIRVDQNTIRELTRAMLRGRKNRPPKELRRDIRKIQGAFK